ncbi:hypothetical protein [Microbispora sp. H10836]|uniref:hypothetical protein n=1 Tax=Microbispora sp. H10836 TaxID=2729106 RepID=UPI0014752C81|nr:hypothetical protein [Microbispora sp. H10836]
MGPAQGDWLIKPARPKQPGVRTMAAEPNPLSEDPALFDMYMTALDRVMARPEIRSALADLRLPGSAVRSRLLVGAHRVLSLAPDEYAAYRAELSRRTHVGQAELPGPDLPDELDALRYVSRRIAGAGIVIIAFGALARWWDWSWIALWAGGTAVTAAAAAHLLSKPRIGLINGHEVLRRGPIPDWSSSLTLARDRLIVAVSRVELLAQVRTLLNTMRENRFDHAFSVSSSPGLSEVYDSAYNVDTHTIDQVDALIRSVAGISLGIAGPRGSGKSTIVRRYCSPGSPPAAPREPPGATGDDLRCMVSAPVDYAARDFVLHLFATFCRAVVAHYATPRHAGRAAFRRRVRGLRRVLAGRAGTVVHHGLVLLLMLVVAQPVSVLLGVPPAWVAASAAAPALFGLVRQTKRWSGLLTRRRASRRARAGIVAAARRNLLRVRFLQSRTLGWSSGVKLAAGFEGQVTGSVTHAEQPLSYPEVVEQFRSFAHRVATFAHARGENVFVGVDELDKIGSADQAEQFLKRDQGHFRRSARVLHDLGVRRRPHGLRAAGHPGEGRLRQLLRRDRARRAARLRGESQAPVPAGDRAQRTVRRLVSRVVGRAGPRPDPVGAPVGAHRRLHDGGRRR